MRVIKNFRIFRAQRIARNGDFDRARKIVLSLISQYPSSVGYNIFLADIELFSGNLAEALEQYEISKEILEDRPEISNHNRRYYTAYVSFRTTAIKFKNADQEWSNWMEAAKLIEGLSADRNIKRLLLPPI